MVKTLLIYNKWHEYIILYIKRSYLRITLNYIGTEIDHKYTFFYLENDFMCL